MICRKTSIRAWQIFSRLFNEILVRYQKFSGWQGKKPEFVYKEKQASPLQIEVIY
jgi:hypothetical protein